MISFLFVLAGLTVKATGQHRWTGWLLLGAGLIGATVTIAKNVIYAWRSDVDSLPGRRLWYRAIVAYLHFIQPLARVRGRIRGILSPPEVALPSERPQTSRGPRPSLAEAWRSLLLISGTVTEDRFWTETWTSTERVLSQLTDWLRRSRAVHTIGTTWTKPADDRDISVFVGRWAWLDVRALVEDHGGGRGLLRVSTNLRPTSFGIVSAFAVGVALAVLRRRGPGARPQARRRHHRGPDAGDHCLHGLADRANHGDRPARGQSRRHGSQDDGHALGSGACAADRAVLFRIYGSAARSSSSS